MKIDSDVCIVCEACIPYCPMEAILVKDDAVAIDQEECVDCGVCLRSGVCPVDCIYAESAPWPRSLRASFSNPRIEHKATGIGGRGTEEMKTNDVTGRFKRGWVGLGVELGRPGVGTRFRDVDKVTRALARQGVEFESKNPLTALMDDVSTGSLREDVLNEKVLSAVIECLIPIEKLNILLETLQEVSRDIDTVFSACVINRCDPDGSYPLRALMDETKTGYYINGKQNAGLGRPLAEV